MIVGEKTASEAQIRQLHVKAGAEIPALREREMVTAAIMQRLNIESDQLTREQQTQQLRKDELTKRRAHYDADLTREEKSRVEDQQRVERFERELRELQKPSNEEKHLREQAAQKVEKAQSLLLEAEQHSLSLGTSYAEQKAHSKRSGARTDRKTELDQFAA